MIDISLKIIIYNKIKNKKKFKFKFKLFLPQKFEKMKSEEMDY